MILTVSIDSVCYRRCYRYDSFVREPGYCRWTWLFCLGDSIVTSFREFQKFKPVRIIVIIWMVLAPITDLFIAALLVYFLVRCHHTPFFCKNNFMATFFFFLVFLIYSVRNEQVSRTQIACWINLHCVRSLHHHKFQFVDCRTDFAKSSFLDLIWWLVTVQTGLITAFDAVIGLLLFVSLFIYYPRKEELIDLSTLLKTSWRW